MNIFNLLKKNKPAEFNFPIVVHAVTADGEKPIVLPSEVSGFAVYDKNGNKILTAPKFVPDVDLNIVNETVFKVLTGVYSFGVKNGKGDVTPVDGDINVSAGINILQELIKRIIEATKKTA